MTAPTKKDITQDLRWWWVSILIIPCSLVVLGLGYVALQVAAKKATLSSIADGFLTITFGGTLLFGPFVWVWGVLVGLLVWPLIWRCCSKYGLNEAKSAACAAFATAILGGVMPFSYLAQHDLDSFAGIFLVAAVIAAFLAPLIAWRIFLTPENEEV